MRNFDWSPAEKRIAQRAFDAAFERELSGLTEKLRARAASARTAEDLWSIEQFLASARREIESKYDYRYSQLPVVFGRLLREKLIDEQDLDGLDEEKVAFICGIRDL